MRKHVVSRRRFLAGMVAAPLVLGGYVYAGHANGDIGVREVRVPVPGLPPAFDGFRIVQLSDLHETEFDTGNQGLIELVGSLHPDIVVDTGDLLSRREPDMEPGVRLLGSLAHSFPVYSVTGNHEWASRIQADVERGLSGAGVRVLRNEAVRLDRAGARLFLAGVDDPNAWRPEEPQSVEAGLEYALAVEKVLGSIPKNAPRVLLAHRPEELAIYARCRASLVLSGHAHGGQIRVPGLGGLFAPQQGVLPPYTTGPYALGETTMLVSRGLGNSGFPLRVNNRPEVMAITLARA